MSYKGADYRKTDLQLHSPRDDNWKGGRPDEKLPEGTSAEDIAAVRRQWASDFIDACITKGVQVAALTDHHEGVYCWYVLAEVEKRKTQGTLDFWFMPGMELTCKDSAQVLILFDWDLSRVLFDKVRNKLGMKADVVENKKTGIKVDLLKANFNDLQSLLEEDVELRNRFIILPNVTPGGHKTVLRDGSHERFKEMPYRGGYLDKMYPDAIPAGDRRALNGEVPAWSTRAISLVSTSDARTADFANVGQYATWLKMAVPTAESLRQAMLAASSRILYAQPEQPELYIESVAVTDAKFLSLNEPIHFSSQFSAVIGGRGSGKSTLLEYIRYALGISALENEGEKYDPTYKRRRELLESTLSNKNSQVAIIVVQKGVSIRLSRMGGNADRVIMHIAGNAQTLSLEDTRTMFPVQAYSQGELSHLGDDQAENRLFELITASHRSQLEAVENETKAVAGELRQLLQQVVEYWRLDSQRRKIEAQMTTINAGIEQAKLGLIGLEAKTQTIIDHHQEVANTNRWFEQLRAAYRNSHENLVSAFQAHLLLSEIFLGADKIPVADDAQKMAAFLREQVEATSEAHLKVLTAHEDFEKHRAVIESDWVTAQEAHTAEYEKAVETANKYTASLNRLEDLKQQQAGEIQKRDILTKAMEPLQEARNQIKLASAKYISHQHTIRRLANESANQLSTLTNDQARAELWEHDDTMAWDLATTDLFAKSGVHRSRIEGLLEKLEAATNPLEEWWNLIGEVLDILHWKITGLYETAKRPALPILDKAIDTGGLQKFSDQLVVDRINAMLVATVKPRIRLLQKRAGSEVEFNQSSQGEKATILLNVLMRQPGGPLILDQPEEDLDNRIIGDIVTATHDAKTRKQLLFATHNANLVVNGDAELVVDLANGSINQVGAIDLPPLRESITETMEGGKEAFELRRHKYNF